MENPVPSWITESGSEQYAEFLIWSLMGQLLETFFLWREEQPLSRIGCLEYWSPGNLGEGEFLPLSTLSFGKGSFFWLDCLLGNKKLDSAHNWGDFLIAGSRLFIDVPSNVDEAWSSCSWEHTLFEALFEALSDASSSAGLFFSPLITYAKRGSKRKHHSFFSWGFKNESFFINCV